MWHELCNTWRILLKPLVLGVQIIQVGNHRPIAVAVDSDDLAYVFFKKICIDDAARLKSTPKSNLFRMLWTLLDLLWIGYRCHPKHDNFVCSRNDSSRNSLVSEDDFSMKISYKLFQSLFSESTLISTVVYLSVPGSV